MKGLKRKWVVIAFFVAIVILFLIILQREKPLAETTLYDQYFKSFEQEFEKLQRARIMMGDRKIYLENEEFQHFYKQLCQIKGYQVSFSEMQLNPQLSGWVGLYGEKINISYSIQLLHENYLYFSLEQGLDSTAERVAFYTKVNFVDFLKEYIK